MTTMFPVTCAVKMPKLRNPITSTIPAITLSNVGIQTSDRECAASCDGPTPARTAVGSIVDMSRSRHFVTQVIDDQLGDDKAEAHR